MRTLGRVMLLGMMATAARSDSVASAAVLLVCLALWNPRATIDAIIDWRQGVEVQRSRWDRMRDLVRSGR